MTTRNSRPRRGAATGGQLKLHRRVMVLDGRVHTVITLRSGTDFRFSTNRFHDTWHILSDWRGARVLARLLWGLSYQRRPGTLLVIDGRHLDPNPFDGAPAAPIVLVPTDRTVFTRKSAAALSRRLPLHDRPDGTVRWQTFGLDPAMAEVAAWRERMFAGAGEYSAPPRGRSRIDRYGRLLVFAGSAEWLRDWAVGVARLGDDTCLEMDYTYLDDGVDGEVQIFRQYRRMVGSARQARTEVCGAAGAPPRTVDSLQSRIWSRAAAIRRRGLPVLPRRG
ncbi:hypothetical protein HGA13_06310 [Nocardia speluncae]|uniref:Uncharacterized protein n=1 Tax=Nocardia speluncae TaxID=419477 RepID=A0A846X902_9NOCA|nr:hypothetical protein [Nocardia speluncae]NKY32691.1 hypothetical protein [Nocardia speluncae]